MLVALVAVSALLVLLFRATTGPGEVLRDFARAMADEDCPGSYALLDPTVQEELTEDEWCAALPGPASHLSPDFEIERVVLEGDVARIAVSRERSTPGTWLLRRADRSWRVLGAGGGVEFPSG